MTTLTDQDLRNANARRIIADRQNAEYGECQRLAAAVLGPGWEPWMKLVLVDADFRRTGDATPAAVAFKVRRDGEARYLAAQPDGTVACAERYEDLFGPLLAEKHPTKTIEVKGKRIAVERNELHWSALELYQPKSAEQLSKLRESRDRAKEERAERKFQEETPLFALAERIEKEDRKL